ncbi:MAG: phosphotransferase [Chloroflexi bacterium]|nr:phosphotransferase [Chloroflexota bacterium]
MMRLSTMLRVDATADPEGRSWLAQEILGRWAHDPGSERFFRSSTNFLYRFQSSGTGHFLRFADGAERRREDVVAEMDVVRSLAASGLKVASPVRSGAGRLVETVETNLGTFHAVVLPALEGSTLEIDELEAARFRAWGAALGRLHVAMRQLPDDLIGRRRTWRDDLAIAARHIPADARAMRRELSAVSTVLEALPDDADSIGLIHFDFELDNLVWRDGEIGVLDFDDCARYWYEADVVFALGELFDGRFDASDPSYREFLAGYETVRDPGPMWQGAAPDFVRLAELLRHARVLRALDLSPDDQQPDWLAPLHRKLADRLAAYEATLG